MRRRIIPWRARRAKRREATRAVRRLYEVTRETWKASTAPLFTRRVVYPEQIIAASEGFTGMEGLIVFGSGTSAPQSWDEPDQDEPDVSGVDDARAAAALNAREKAQLVGRESGTWVRDRGMIQLPAPVVDMTVFNDVLYVACDNGQVYRVDPTQGAVWPVPFSPPGLSERSDA